MTHPTELSIFDTEECAPDEAITFYFYQREKNSNYKAKQQQVCQ